MFSYSRQYIDNLAAEAGGAPNSETRAVLDTLVAKRVNKEQFAHSRKRQTLITAQIDSESFAQLEKLFPESDLTLEINSYHAHGVAAAARQCEMEVLLTRARAGKNRIVDGGGNCPLYVSRKYPVHSCRPLLSARDKQRNVKMIAQLKDLMKCNNVQIVDYASEALGPTPNNFLCYSPCEMCTYKADAMITCHSAYDFTLPQQCAALISHHCDVLYGTFLFEPAMLVNSKGHSKFLNYEWRINILYCEQYHPLGGLPCRHSCQGHEIIDYFFKDDGSFNYRHDFSPILRMLKTMHYTIGGYTFICELHENRAGIQFYELTKITTANTPSSYLSRRIHFSSLSNTTFVRVFKYDDYASSDNNRLYTRIEAYPEKVVTLARRYCSTHQEDKIKMDDIMTYISSTDNTVTINGSYVQIGHTLSAEACRDLVISIYMEDISYRAKAKVLVRQIKETSEKFAVVASARWYKLQSWAALLKELSGAFITWLFGDTCKNQVVYGDQTPIPSANSFASMILSLKDYSEYLPLFQSFDEPVTFEQYFDEREILDDCVSDTLRYIPDTFDTEHIKINSIVNSQPKHPSLIPITISIGLRNIANQYLTQKRNERLFVSLADYSDAYGRIISDIKDHYFYYDLPLPSGLDHAADAMYDRYQTRTYFANADDLNNEIMRCRADACYKSIVCRENVIDVSQRHLAECYRLGNFPEIGKFLFHLDDFAQGSIDGNYLTLLPLPWLRSKAFWQHLIFISTANRVSTYHLMATEIFGIDFEDSETSQDLELLNQYYALDNLLDLSAKKPKKFWDEYRAKNSFRDALKEKLVEKLDFQITYGSLKAIEIFQVLRSRNYVFGQALFIGESPCYFHDIYFKAGLGLSTILTLSPQYKDATHSISLSSIYANFIHRDKGDVTKVTISGKVNFVCSDVGSEDLGTVLSRERKFSVTLVKIIDNIERVLAPGGNAVIKIYSLAYNDTREQVVRLHKSFSTVELFKLKASSAYSTERYLICSNYLGDNVNPISDIFETERYFVTDLLRMHQHRLEQCVENYPVPDFRKNVADWIRTYMLLFEDHVVVPITPSKEAPFETPEIDSIDAPEVITNTKWSDPIIRDLSKLDISKLGPIYANRVISGEYLGAPEIRILNDIHATHVCLLFYERPDHTFYTYPDVPNNADIIYIHANHAYVNSGKREPTDLTRLFEQIGYAVPGFISMPIDGDCVLHAYKYLSGIKTDNHILRKEISNIIIQSSHKAGGIPLEVATTELIKYWEAETEDNLLRARYDWNSAVRRDNVIYQGAKLQYERDTVIYLRRKSDHLFAPFYSDLGDTSTEYESAFNGKEFVNISIEDNMYKSDSNDPILMVSRHMVLIQGPRLGKYSKKYVPHSPFVYVHSGVAGAGKTTDIINRVETGDLVLTALKCSAEETAGRIAITGKKITVKTADSYLINDRKTYRNVYFDEAFVVHAGYVGLISGFAKCDTIHCYGDPNQIPALARVAGFRFHANTIQASSSDFQNISKRCPLDVCRAINKHYLKISAGKTITTKNPQTISMEVIKIANLGCVPTHSDVHYVVWTQSEKKTLQKSPAFRNVKTIHEKQGSTVKNLALIRLNTKTIPLFESTHHAISAITRHTRSFKYYTIILSRSDAVQRLIYDAPDVPLKRFLDEDPFDKCWDDRAGGIGYVERLIKPRVVYDQRGVDIREEHLRLNAHIPINANIYKRYSRKCEYIGKNFVGTSAVLAPVTDNIRTAQLSYDLATGHPAEYDESFQSMQVEHGDVELNLSNLKWKRERNRLDFKRTFNEKFDVRSHLRTAQPFPRPRTAKQTLLALQKRNGNAFRQSAPKDPQKLATDVITSVMDTIGVPDWKQVSQRFTENSISICREAIDDYLISVGQSKWHSFEQPRNANETKILDARALNNYECVIKIEPKNRLSPESLGEFQPLQTVIHHKPFVNLMASFFRLITERLLEILDPRVCVQIRKSMSDLEQHFDRFVGTKSFKAFENDFGKFDKSQFDETYSIEEQVFKMLGLDALIAHMWANSYTEKQIRIVEHAIKLVLYYQRNSGTVTTGLGNLIVNLFCTVFAACIKRNDYRAIYAVGDDSLFILENHFQYDPADISISLATYFNLESKVITGLGLYFCSAFFVFNGQKWLIMPDPIKKTERLSLPLNSQSAKDTFADRWNSLRDLCSSYRDAVAAERLNEQCLIRYGRGNVMGMIRSVVAAMDDFKSFMALFRV